MLDRISSSSIIGLIFIVVIYAMYWNQPALSADDGIIYDAKQYYIMSTQMIEGKIPILAEAPFVHRLGTPYLATLVNSLDIVEGFVTVNIISGIVLSFFVYLIIRHFTKVRGIWFFLLLVLLTNIHNPARFSHFYPVYVDPLALLFCAVILYTNTIYPHSTKRLVLFFSVICFFGCLVRELVFAATFATLFSYSTFSVQTENRVPAIKINFKELTLKLVPVLFGLLGIAVTRHLGEATPDIYSFVGHSKAVMFHHYHNPFKVITSFFTGVGPIALVFVLLLRYITRENFKELQTLFAFFGFCLFASYGAGLHSERFLFWGLLSLLPILAVQLNNFVARHSPASVILFLTLPAIGQALSQRVLLPLPDIPNTIDGSKYENVDFILFNSYGDNIIGWDVLTIGMDNDILRAIAFQNAALFLAIALVYYLLLKHNQSSG